MKNVRYMDKRKVVELFDVDRLTFLAILISLKAPEFKAVMCKLEKTFFIRKPWLNIRGEVFKFSKRKSSFISHNKKEIQKLLNINE